MAECAAVTDQNNAQQCPICIDILKKPRSLPCLHSFCESCLGDYIGSVFKRKPGLASSFPCPSCRADTNLPCDVDLIADCGKSIAEKFPINADIPTMESEKSKTCDICNARGLVSVVASSWCQDCEELLCDNCKEYHQSIKISKGHKVVQIDEVHEGTQHQFSSRCSYHRMTDVTFYCFSHEKPCCVKCAATKHRVCDTVEELNTILQDPGLPGKYREIHNELICIQSDLNIVLQNREQNVARLGEQHLEIKEKLTCLQTTIVKHVQNMLSDALSKINNEREQETATIQRDTDWIRDHHKLVSRLLSKAETTEGSELCKFLTYRKMQRNMASMKTELPGKLVNMYDCNLEFVPDESLTDFLQQISKFGSVSVKKESCKYYLSSNTARQQTYDVIPVSSFKVSLLGEMTQPLIRSILFLEDDTLLIFDAKNKSLKIYDKKGALQRRVFTRGYPGFLTRMHGKRYAVTEPELCEIDVYEISNEITLISTIKSPHGVLGIAFLNDVFILTCKDHVCVLDQRGECLQYMDKNSRGESMFSSAHYMISDALNNVIYISDYGSNKVFSFKQHPTSKYLKQEPLHIYSHHQLRTPCGIAVDKFGNLLVCGNASGNVHLFDREGSHLKIICSKITGPLSLEFDSCYDRLVLSVNSAPFKIHVFKTS
ncbi:hypothetical protein ACJMK2_032266 [Sinanodonta woodiana]|uniref:Uncharacterized protein n=1 Tax=Sinanodonta woodiana TaxID=1069815 RepID=A0ABD3X170_SINWO